MKISVFVLVILLVTLSACASDSNIQTQTIDASVLVQEYVALADEYSEMEQYEKAVELLEKAIQYDSENLELVYLVARTSALAQQWTNALENYNNLLNLDENNLLLQKSIAWIYAQSGEIEESKNLYKKLYAEYYYDKEVATNYILVLVAAGENGLASTILDEYATLYPDEANLEDLRNMAIIDVNIDEDDSSKNEEVPAESTETSNSDNKENTPETDANTTL